MPMTQPAGKRNVLLTVEKNAPTTATDGQKVDLWSKSFDHWAEIIPRGGREARVFAQLRAEIDYIVRMPLDSLSRNIKPATHRLKVKRQQRADKVLNIDSLIEVGFRESLVELRCMEVLV